MNDNFYYFRKNTSSQMFDRVVVWEGLFKRGWQEYEGHIKNKLRSEIFNDKKSLWAKIFFFVITKNSNWEILTKNLFFF